jgi:hypothetical protein
MHRNEQHLVIIVELLLGTVTVMDVPIEYAHALPLIPCELGRNSNVVKNAKTGRLTATSMMAGRSHDTIPSLDLLRLAVIFQDCLQASQRRQRCQTGCMITRIAIVNIVSLVGDS